MGKETHNRGGAREGAGRHTKGSLPRVTTTLMLDRELKQRAQEQAQRRGITFSDFINELLMEELAK